MTRSTVRYAAACAALALLGVAVTWPLLDGAGRTGIVTAAALALPLQVAAFGALAWGWSERNRFLATWVGGVLGRLALLGAGAALVITTDLSPAPTLLALAGFLFVMLLIEPLFIGREPLEVTPS